MVCRRAAALVACSWPRAELTSLSYDHGRGTFSAAIRGPRARSVTSGLVAPDLFGAQALVENLNSAASNRERCRILLAHYADGQCLRLPSVESTAAQERMLALIAQPKIELNEIRKYAEHAFRRLYRMRNIVMHGGAASAAGLDVTLRTAAPLAGAALDRIAHAQLVTGVSPLTLAARADVHLQLISTPGAPTLADLLE